MDLKALREQAINEANDEFAEEKINDFKVTIRDIVHNISENNAFILKRQKTNEVLKERLRLYELKEFERVVL